KKVNAVSVPLRSIADVQRGITPYLLTDMTPNNKYAYALDGELRRYTYAYSATKCVEYHNGIAEYQPPGLFRGTRVIVRELISRQFRIQAVLTSQDFVVNKSHQIVAPRIAEWAAGYLAAIL